MVSFMRDLPRWAVFVIAVAAVVGNAIASEVLGEDAETARGVVTAIVLFVLALVFGTRALGRRNRGGSMSGPYPRSARDLD